MMILYIVSRFRSLSFMLLWLSFSMSILAQDKGRIEGRLFNEENNQPVPFANLVIIGSNIGSISDMEGNYLFTGIKPGFVSISISALGYETVVTDPVMVTNANTVFLDVPMTQTGLDLDEVVVEASPFQRKIESPVSFQRVGIAEIEKNPGGNRDISRVIQSFPGVASTPAFRNDVIVRGGGASENVFYLDGVEIPVLNHFSTQGASGGPVGIINVDFVREVDFYTGAFPANRGNALSSVLDFKQVDGNRDKLKTRATVGASDLALTLDGPLSERTTMIASARRSYLQFLFAALELPFLPTYTDFQFKTRTRFDDQNELTVIGLGAYDVNRLNLDANETPAQRIILADLPENIQWNYTFGAVYKRFRKGGFDSYIMSRNYLNNRFEKFKDNDKEAPKTFDYFSAEAENKFRFERTLYDVMGYKLVWGAGGAYATYENATENNIVVADSLLQLRYESSLELFNYQAFAQISKTYFSRLLLSLGTRIDGSSYASSMQNPLEQFSPRFSISYELAPRLSLNANTGRFFQRPAYTTMGYRNRAGEFVNKTNGLRYIRSDHFVAGIEWVPDPKSVISLEGFYKTYAYYPVSVADSISISGKGADFATFGDEEVISDGKGRSYGLEVLARSRDIYGVNAIFAYTLVWSEFEDVRTSKYVPTAWDNRHLLNLTLTRSFANNWDLGMKWRYVGGAPYTPVDEYKSSLVYAWDAQNRAYLDYAQFNQLRTDAFHQLDVRIDKSFYFNRWSLMLYVDVQNVYGFAADQPDIYTREALVQNKALSGDPYVDPVSGQPRYKMQYVNGLAEGTVLPTIGIIVEF